MDLHDPQHAPEASLDGHLTFALKYEGLDLAVLKTRFKTVGPAPIQAMIQRTPSGVYSRRVWFLYEWLIGTELDLRDTSLGHYVDALDEWGQAVSQAGRADLDLRELERLRRVVVEGRFVKLGLGSEGSGPYQRCALRP